MKSKDSQLELNQMHTTAEVFLEFYNETLPQGFPVATLSSLKEFQTAYPSLFKDKDKWSIEKHRKRLMDWLLSNAT